MLTLFSQVPISGPDLSSSHISRAKLVWFRRDMGFLRTRKQRFAYRLMANMPDAVFAVSERVRQYSIDVDRIQPERIQTIYNGVCLTDWRQSPDRGKASSECLVISVGNIRRVKGYDLLLRAAATVAGKYPRVVFKIVGEVLDPEYFNELNLLARELRLGSRLKFERVTTDLREHLRDADVFVLPSRSEGFSNAILEAMASSLPVVAADIGGNAEAVEDGTTGLLIPPENPDALATAIMQLMSDPTRAKAMGELGRAVVAERFTVETMMEKIVNAYKNLL